ncbi:MAG: DUF3784 domain-containing protein [Defluviitaleaceae bacterium]|nr:DUF3784 domain-containing protein [Defluviitaleaceae bacterium]
MVGIIIGAVVVVAGLLVLVFRANWLVAGYRQGKFDEEKFAKTAGITIMLFGIVMVASSLVMPHIPSEHDRVVSAAFFMVIIAIIGKGYYMLFKHCKKKEE